jgi:hypothetical protein
VPAWLRSRHRLHGGEHVRRLDDRLSGHLRMPSSVQRRPHVQLDDNPVHERPLRARLQRDGLMPGNPRLRGQLVQGGVQRRSVAQRGLRALLRLRAVLIVRAAQNSHIVLRAATFEQPPGTIGRRGVALPYSGTGPCSCVREPENVRRSSVRER